MSKQTTLLNFFTKSPAARPLSNIANNVNNNSTTKSTVKKEKFEIYDIVYARLTGFDHWPALVCAHGGKFFKTEKNVEYLNVQFFDNPPQRAWIKVQDCIKMTDGKHPKLTQINDESLKQAIKWALDALSKSKEDRKSLVLLLNSDDESDEERSSDVEMSPLNQSSRIIKNNANTNTKRKYESDSDESDQNQVQSAVKKKKMFVIESDESGDDYKPSKMELNLESSSDEDDSALLSDEFSDVASFVGEEDESMDSIAITPPKRSSANRSKASKSTGKKSSKKSADSTSANVVGDSCLPAARKFAHESYDFLKPEKIRDKNGKRPDDPDYDPKTLYVPSEFLKKQSQAQQQWWAIKSDHFDTILFFKMGKFYELYHQDAVIICELTNIMYMRGESAHAGFPEKAYQRFADVLIEKGYQVARVEQTESAGARDKRCKGSSDKSKCVKRELCRITSRGTKYLNEMDNCENSSIYLFYVLAITEKEIDDNQILTGLCFIECSIGTFHIGQLVDDKHSTSLRTIFAHYPPVEILIEKDHITTQTLQTIKSCLPNVSITYLRTDVEFWKPRKTLKLLTEGPYFKEKREDGKFETRMPAKLQELLDPNDPLNLTVKKEFELALKSMGAIIYQLKRNLIEEELLAKKDFNIFDTSFLLTNKYSDKKDYMVLDSVTIKNLELFENSSGRPEGTLLNEIDSCQTKFGKRRLRKWMCSPLYSKKEINDRLDAVSKLMELSSLNDLHRDLKQLPDLERILFKIHTQSLPNRSRNHPDSRAVMMEAQTYNKAKVGEFCKLIDSFNRCDRFINELRGLVEKSSGSERPKFLLDLITYKEDGGIFPNTVQTLKYFDNSFDQRIAKEKGLVQPRKGVNKEFEKATENIQIVHKKLNQHLSELSRRFGEKLTWFGTGKKAWQVQIPSRLASKVGSEFEKTSAKKGFDRYQDKTIKDLIVELKDYEEAKEEAMHECWRIILFSFMEHKEDWLNIVKIIAVIDCLISLTNFSNQIKMFGKICRPVILDETSEQKSVIRYKNGVHPSLIKIVDNFMANSVTLDEKILLLSGPNMGGKSVSMRQTGQLVLLAQMGSFVPAEQFECTLVDRIFVRLGSTDRILDNESTFFVELSETSCIIKNATKNSLVLLDELGRGTSSIDGTAIACSVVDYLSNKIKCPTMFSTHYSTLLEEFKNSPNVLFGHMACVLEKNDSEADFDDPTNETITFLYKLTEGICPKSYGFHCAKLSGITDRVIKDAYEKAKEFENSSQSIKLLAKLVSKNLNINEAKQLVNYLVS